jgi:hypothetical protein
MQATGTFFSFSNTLLAAAKINSFLRVNEARSCSSKIKRCIGNRHILCRFQTRFWHAKINSLFVCENNFPGRQSGELAGRSSRGHFHRLLLIRPFFASLPVFNLLHAGRRLGGAPRALANTPATARPSLPLRTELPQHRVKPP